MDLGSVEPVVEGLLASLATGLIYGQRKQRQDISVSVVAGLRRFNFSRSVRNHIAIALWAGPTSSFPTFMVLFFMYFNSRPAHPDAAHGLLYSLNNHGSHVYLNANEATGLSLLMLLFGITFVAGLAIVPKELIPLPPNAHWSARLGVSYKTDLADASPPLKRTFVASIVVFALLIWLAGPHLVAALIAHGVVLHWI